MIILLHGDNQEASRGELVRLKAQAKAQEIRELNGKTLTPTELTQALESASLFGDQCLVVVENLFGNLAKKPKATAELVAIIKRSGDATDIIIWEPKEVGASAVSGLGPKTKALLFKIPGVIFQLLDAIKPDNARQLLLLYRQAQLRDPAELVLSMIVRRVRQLIMAKDGVYPKNLQDWQKARLTNQSRYFTMEQLRAMYSNLLDREYSLKTGATPFDLPTLIEQFFIDL